MLTQPPDEMKWATPWQPLKEAAEALVIELHKELSPQHVLHGVPVVAIARRVDCDDVLFATADPLMPLAVVHLTCSSHAEPDPKWPWTTLFQSWPEFVERCLVPDHKEYSGDEEIE